MSQLLVSVIITTYNRPQLLRGAIASVLQQQDVDFELLVIDDYSVTREAEPIVDAFRDSRIRYIRNEINRGGAASLNRGLQEARGVFIAVLDDDDEWILSDKLRKQVDFLKKNSDYVAVATQVVVVAYDSSKVIKRSSLPMGDRIIRKSFLSLNPMAHSSVVYRTKIARDVGGYDLSLPRGKDYDLMLKLAVQGKVAVLPEHAVRYRESTFANRDLIALRLQDTRAKISVILKHRKRYPRFLPALLEEYKRLILFFLFKQFPFLLRK